jgi:hypothetical protein
MAELGQNGAAEAAGPMPVGNPFLCKPAITEFIASIPGSWPSTTSARGCGMTPGALEEVCRAKLAGRTPQSTLGVVEVFRHDLVYSSDQAMRELRFRVTPLEEGLTKTHEALHG